LTDINRLAKIENMMGRVCGTKLIKKKKCIENVVRKSGGNSLLGRRKRLN
jgi:hypothetical protein